MLVPPECEISRLKQIEHEKRQNEVIEGLLDNFEEEIVEGDNITVHDCLKAPIKKFELRGKDIKRETRNGHNKLNLEEGIYESSNNKYTLVVKNGECAIKAIDENDVTTNVSFLVKLITPLKLKNGENYTIVNGTNLAYPYINLRTDIHNQYEAMTATDRGIHNFISESEEDVEINYVFIHYNTNNKVDSFPMFLEGTYTAKTLPDFEQYGAMPSLEFESPLEYVKGNNEIEHVNKNLIDFSNPNFVTTVTNYTFKNNILKIENEAGSYKRAEWDILDIFKNNPGKTLKFGDESIDFSNSVKGSIQLRISENKKNSYYEMVKENKNNGYIIPNDISNIAEAVIGIYSNNSSDAAETSITIIKPMLYIEDEKTSTDYVEHKSQKYQLTNLPPMYSKNDKIVYLEKNDENAIQGEGWYVYNTYFKHIFDGTEKITSAYSNSENWFLNLNLTLNNMPLSVQNSSGEAIYSNMFLNSSVTSVNTNLGIAVYVEAVRMRLEEEITLAEFMDLLKERFSNNNALYIIYKLAIPTYTKITDKVLINQLNELQKMMSYKGINHLIVTAENGQPIALKATIYKDSMKIMQDEINNLKALILES